MKTSSLLGGLLALMIVAGSAFGAGYFVAKDEFQSTPKTVGDVAKVESLDEPTLDSGEPLELNEKREGADEENDKPLVSDNDPKPEVTPKVGEEGTANNATGNSGEEAPVVDVDHNKAPDTPEETEKKAAKDAIEELKKKLEELGDIDGIEPGAFEEMMNGPKVDFVGTLKGQVFDAGGVPVAGAQIRANFSENFSSDGGGMSMGFVVASDGSNNGKVIATTDGGGYFTAEVNRKVAEKATLNASLTASADGYAESKKNKITLKNGETKEGIKLELRGAGGVTGRVLDSSGLGVEGVTVGLNTSGNGMGDFTFEYGGGSKYSAKTDVGGNFTIEGVPEGRYKFKLTGSGYRQVAGPTEIDIKTGLIEQASTDFQVAVTTSISITCVDAANEPVRGWATISFIDGDKTVKKMHGSIGDDGVFQKNDPPAGNFKVEIKVWGYKTHTAHANINEGQRFDLGTIILEESEDMGGPRGGTIILPGDDE